MWLMIVPAFVLGLLIGSFLNVVIARLPAGEDIVVTASHCPKCGERIAWYDLIPVVSFLALRGRCRKCGAPISKRYPAVELLTGCVYALIVWRYGLSVNAVFFALSASILIAAAFIDADTRRIPNGLTLTLLLTAVLYRFLTGASWQTWVAGALSVALPLYLLWLISKGGLIGLGDIKLYVGAGLLLGWQKALLSFGLACIIASVIHLIRMKFFGAGRELALGPYLSAGILITMLFGDALLHYVYGV